MLAYPSFPAEDDGPSIDLQSPADIRRWCQRLRVSLEALREAVAMVGPGLADVQQHLAIAELAYHRSPLMAAQQRRRIGDRHSPRRPDNAG